MQRCGLVASGWRGTKKTCSNHLSFFVIAIISEGQASHFGSSIIALHAQPWPCKPRCSLSHVLSLAACRRRFEMMPMLVAVTAEFRYVVLVADSMLEQFYVRFVHRLFLLLPGLHWHPRAMPLFPALCSSWRSLPMLHCRS